MGEIAGGLDDITIKIQCEDIGPVNQESVGLHIDTLKTRDKEPVHIDMNLEKTRHRQDSLSKRKVVRKKENSIYVKEGYMLPVVASKSREDDTGNPLNNERDCSVSPSQRIQDNLRLCERCHQRRVSEERKTNKFSCHSFREVCTIKMVRILGQCVLFVLFVSSGGYLVNKIGTDVSEQFPAQFLHSDIYKEVRLRPVSLRTFRKQLSETTSYYDLLRIFFDRKTGKSISNKEIDELLTARTLKQTSGHLNIREMSSSEDYTEEDFTEYEDYALQDTGSYVVEDLLNSYDHIAEMDQSPLGQCKDPQPEIIHVKGEGDSKLKLFFPECTVLYRCRNVSGCCTSSSEVCGPKAIEVITKSFFVMEVTGPDLVQPDKIQMVETRDFINHTECECQEIKGLPGCNKECPVPYVNTRHGLRCTCDCVDENESCIDIKHGLRPLDEEMLMGIKEKLFMMPECEEGVFDIKTGYCPQSSLTAPHRKRHDHHRQRSKGNNWKQTRNKGKKNKHKEKQKTSS